MGNSNPSGNNFRHRELYNIEFSVSSENLEMYGEGEMGANRLESAAIVTGNTDLAEVGT
jgi:hypothetical protein